jgi:hypothetical protein
MDASRPRDLTIVPPISEQHDDPCPLRELLSRRMPADQPLQFRSLLATDLDRRQLRPRHRALLTPAGNAILPLSVLFSQGVLDHTIRYS